MISRQKIGQKRANAIFKHRNYNERGSGYIGVGSFLQVLEVKESCRVRCRGIWVIKTRRPLARDSFRCLNEIHKPRRPRLLPIFMLIAEIRRIDCSFNPIPLVVVASLERREGVGVSSSTGFEPATRYESEYRRGTLISQHRKEVFMAPINDMIFNPLEGASKASTHLTAPDRSILGLPQPSSQCLKPPQRNRTVPIIIARD